MKNVVVIGSSHGSSYTTDFLLSRLGNIGENAIIVNPHIENRSVYQVLKDQGLPVEGIGIDYDVKIEPGKVYVIGHEYTDAGKFQQKIKTFELSDGRIRTRPKKKDDFSYSPPDISSVDTLMEMVSKEYGQKAAGVILGGYGSDGKNGASKIKNNGGKVFVQIEELFDERVPGHQRPTERMRNYSSGMPSAVTSAVDVDGYGPLDKLAVQLGKHLD